MKYKKILACFLLALMVINICGCSKKAPVKEKQLSLYLDIKDKYTMSIIKYAIDEYKKNNPSVKVNLNNTLGGGNLMEDISKGTEADIIFTSRNSMIELSQKGLLADMGSYYEKNKLSDRYFKIISEYGRVGDKYFGIGFIPYAVEILYNRAALNNLNIAPPANIMDVKAILSKLNNNSIRVPVILTEDIDRLAGVSSILASNIVNAQKLDNAYGSSAGTYKQIKEMQTFFDSIEDLIKTGVIDRNTFELGDAASINALNKGNIPMAISMSYYNSNLGSSNVGLIENYSTSSNSIPNIPVIINGILCVASNSKNGEEAADFIKFALGDDFQKSLVQKGYISGNKKVNENMVGINKIAVNQIDNSNENSVLFLYNMPAKLVSEVISKINSIVTGKYNGNEWNEAVDNSQ